MRRDSSPQSVVIGEAWGKVWRLLVALGLGLGLLVLLSGWLARAAPRQASEPVAASPRLSPTAFIAALVTQVNTPTVMAYERALTGEAAVVVGGRLYTLTTRHSFSGEPISQATRYVYEHFRDLGLDVTFHTYTVAGQRWRNVVAERPGLRRADEIYLITAHLDDLPEGPVAPGADDNASGSTAVLVAADRLGQLDFDATLRFVLFTGEEQGLLGSAAYAADVAAAGEQVRGVLNLDMIGYNSDANPIVDLHAQSTITGSLSIARTFSQVIAAYGLDLTPQILIDDQLAWRSDNGSFWYWGYPAILAIEDFHDFNPAYHSTADTLERLDLDYLTAFVQASVGTFAHMGGLASTSTLTGTVIDADTGLPLTATLTALAPGRVYTTTSGPGGFYSLTLPVYTFTVQAGASGYLPTVVTNVAVSTGSHTVQLFALRPAPCRFFIPILFKP